MNHIEARISDSGTVVLRILIDCDICHEVLYSSYDEHATVDQIVPRFLTAIETTRDTKWPHMREKHKESEARG